jgi:aryl-alcohol dehydrogenase-like predicted oxidoreductase
MEYRRLGQNGLWVSPLCLGTMLFGAQTSEATARRMFDLARAAGVNFIDTADEYVHGRSEEIIGKLVAKDRGDWVIATKVGSQWSARPNESGTGRTWIMRQVEASLRRLGTDYIDIYYTHIDDEGAPVEETARAMGDLIRAGKVRHFGISNYRGWRIALMAEACDRLGVPRPVVCQPYYNAMNRMPEVEVLPACGHYGIGVAPYSPIARGVLTGKYPTAGAPPTGTRAGRGDPRIMNSEYRPESLAIAQIVKQHAERRGMTAAQLAVLWVLNNKLVTAPIVGPRTVAQWKEYLGTLDHRFEAGDEALIDTLVPSGHPSTPGYTDPSYPITGRPVWTA